MTVFYLGTHEPSWLGRVRAPRLFVSRRRLARLRRTLPVATTPWALDSGGFTELSTYGRWTVTERQYVDEVRRYDESIGMLEWAAPQDWMCEPQILAKTGLSVEQHQRNTIENYLRLRDLWPDSAGSCPIKPVLQGWTPGDYLRCVEMYDRSGVDLQAETLVGVGTVCRRQGTFEIRRLLEELAKLGLSLHGFGVKTLGLQMYAGALASADSLAWSYRARSIGRERYLAGDTSRPPCGSKSCANCLHFALDWHQNLLAKMPNGPINPEEKS